MHLFAVRGRVSRDPGSELTVLTDRVLPTRAVENNLYVVYANRCGVDEGKIDEVFLGQSTVASPSGDIVLQMDAQSGCSHVMPLTMQALKAARERYPLLRDLRHDMLFAIAAAAPRDLIASRQARTFRAEMKTTQRVQWTCPWM